MVQGAQVGVPVQGPSYVSGAEARVLSPSGSPGRWAAMLAGRVVDGPRRGRAAAELRRTPPWPRGAGKAQVAAGPDLAHPTPPSFAVWAPAASGLSMLVLAGLGSVSGDAMTRW